MRWSAVPFGKYQGKTLPEIIVRDLDWFFWIVPKLYGKLADEAEELARRARAIKIPNRVGRVWRSNISMKWVTGFAALRSLTPTMLSILDGRQDFHISICRGLFAENTTSERAAS